MLAMIEDRAMLDVNDVADQLRISVSTIRRLVREGRLRAYRVGGVKGALRFKQEDVDAYLESTLVRPGDPTDERDERDEE